MSLDAITFDTDGFELQGDIDRVRVWVTPRRDRLNDGLAGRSVRSA